MSHLWWYLPGVESRAAEAIRLKEGEVKGGGLLGFIGREARARCLSMDLVRPRCGSPGNQLCG